MKRNIIKIKFIMKNLKDNFHTITYNYNIKHIDIKIYNKDLCIYKFNIVLKRNNNKININNEIIKDLKNNDIEPKEIYFKYKDDIEYIEIIKCNTI